VSAREPPTSLLEWPEGVLRVGVVFLLVVTLVAAAIRYSQSIRDLQGTASRNSALSFSDREIAGGNSVLPDQTAAYEARGLIPEDETYHVAFGPEYAGGTALTRLYAESFYLYFLMPRRPSDDPSWLICYGCDLAEYGARARVEWRGPDDVSIARIEP
jgi:hypothetical protein